MLTRVWPRLRRLRPRRQPSLYARGLIPLLLGIALPILVTALVVQSLGEALGAEAAFGNTAQAARRAAALNVDLARAENAVQAYGFGLEPADAQDFQLSVASIDHDLGKLARTPGISRPALSQIETSIATWRTWAQQRVVALEAGSTPGGADDLAGIRLVGSAQGLLSAYQAHLRGLERAEQVQSRLGARRVIVTLALGALAEVICLLLLAATYFRSALRPVRELAQAAWSMAEGAVAPIPHLGRRDEVGALAAALTAWQRSADLVQQVFAGSPVGIAVVDEALRIESGNPAIHAMLGFGPGELEGRSLAELALGTDRAKLRASFKRPAQDGPIAALDLRYRRRDGSIVWVESRKAPLPSGPHPEPHTVVTFEDLTHRLWAQREIDKLASIVENTTAFVGLADMDGSIAYINDSGRRLVGLGPKDPVESMSIADFLPPPALEQSIQVEQPTLIREGTWIGESALRDFRTGEVIPVQASSFLVRDSATGAPTGMGTVRIDQRGRLEAERERDRALELLALFARSAPTVIFALDQSGHVVFAQGAVLQSLGIAPAAAAGMSLLELLPGSGIDGATVQRSLQGEAVTTQTEIAGRSLEVAFYPVPADDTPGVAVAAIAIDITDRVRADRAQSESQAKSRFLATMSHELRTPLNAVLGFAQLLEQAEAAGLSARQRRYVANIRTGGEHLLGLVNDVLDLAKVASGRLEFRFEESELAGLVERVLSDMSPLAEAKHLTLTSELSSDLRVRTDPLRLTQILINLVSNAIKFTEAGGVGVRAHRVRGAVEIEVWDTGPGIAAEYLESVFDEFMQVDAGLTRPQAGTGLGLPLSRRIAEAMGGRLELKSEIGQGTVARLRLPQPALRRRRQPSPHTNG